MNNQAAVGGQPTGQPVIQPVAQGAEGAQDAVDFGNLFEEAEKESFAAEKPLETQIIDGQQADEAKAASDAAAKAEADAAKAVAPKPDDKKIQGAQGGEGGAGGEDITKDLETSEQRYKTLQGIYRHEKDEWLNEKDKLLSELEAAKTAKPAEQSKAEEDEADAKLKELLASLDLTPEQKAQLAEYDEEFDVVSQMEGLKRKSEMARLKLEFHEMLQGFRKEFVTQLKPAQEFIEDTQKSREEAEKNEHFQTIANAHPDYTKYRDDGSIRKWIESKPAYLQKGLIEQYTKGTAEDIVEMLNDFKVENNITGDEPNPPENVDAINRAKAEKKKVLTSPVTKRAAVNASMAVASDFSGAFDEAIQKTRQ